MPCRHCFPRFAQRFMRSSVPADFKKLFFLQFFPRAEQERLKREYHSIRQTNTETSTEFMQRFLRLAGFLGTAAGTEEEQAKNFQWGLRRSTLNNLVCMSYTDVAQTGEVVVTTIAATTTTLATTTGIPVMGVTREKGVSSPTDLPILADKKPGASGRVFAITEDHATKTS
nr:zinc finger, CCHC-type, retrotransposon Gag domain protein [Tanacetum cinerariifolium]